MKLFIHIGTEKTGSSYLQTLLARNRKQLFKGNIYYPKALKLENQMLAGKISPGNGQHIYEALRDEKYNVVKKHFKNYIKEAKQKDCNLILLSNELFIRAFSDQKTLNNFLELNAKLGLETIKLLLVLRDPVSQALSLYKHRAKNGTVADIRQWVSNGYTLAAELKKFLFNIKNRHELCVIRKYKKDSDYMNSIMFSDWLRIDLPNESVPNQINPSLTLSELVFLKELYYKNKFLSKIYYEKMLNIPIQDKAEDKSFEAYYKSILNNYLVKYSSTWELCNLKLKKEEQLLLPTNIFESVTQDRINLIFSESQYSTIAEILSDSFKVKFYLKLELLKLKNKVSVLKNRLTK